MAGDRISFQFTLASITLGSGGSNRVRDRLFYLASDFRPFVCTFYCEYAFYKEEGSTRNAASFVDHIM